jgi:hypothetical protein
VSYILVAVVMSAAAGRDWVDSDDQVPGWQGAQSPEDRIEKDTI